MKNLGYIAVATCFFLPLFSCTSESPPPDYYVFDDAAPGYGYHNATDQMLYMFAYPLALDSLNVKVGSNGNRYTFMPAMSYLYRSMLPLKDSTGIRLVFGDSLKCLNFEGPITDSLVDPRSPKAYKVNGEAYRYTFEPKHFEMASPCK